MKLSFKLVAIAAILIATIVIGVYAVTTLFSQRVPSASIKPPPSSSSAIGDCSTVSIDSITFSTSGRTEGVMNMTCGSGPAFSVISEGLFAASSTFPCPNNGNCNEGYDRLNVFNYTLWQTQGCGTRLSPKGYDTGVYIGVSSGRFLVLKPGDYVYCLSYTFNQYSLNSPTSMPSFTISWNSS